MKIRRSSRLVGMTHYLLHHPQQLVSLTLFADLYASAKSSVSEDLGIIKQTFEQQGIGTLLTVPGAAGGVKYIPSISNQEVNTVIEELCDLLQKPDRVLPGGYLYMTDILSNPNYVNSVGRMFASIFSNQKIDIVMTIATKGIPLAYAVANFLNVPVVIVRQDNKVTEGSTVSINYVSGSSKRIQTMSLAKRSIEAGSIVLIIDGMKNLLKEFQAKVAGIGVLVEAVNIEERLVEDYISLVKLSEVNEREQLIRVERGNFQEESFIKTESL
jgi:purine operon repressor